MSEVQKSKSGFWRDFTWTGFVVFFIFLFGTSYLTPFLFGDEERKHVFTSTFFWSQLIASALTAFVFAVWGIKFKPTRKSTKNESGI
jgi:predicted permease